jgi:hypothetical protein
MPTAPGYADISIPLLNAALTRTAYVTFGVDSTGTDPSTIADQALTAFTAAGSLGAQIDTNVTIGPAICHLGTDGTADLVGIGSTTAAGGKAGSSTPANVCALFRKTTAVGGRRGRGRMFLPWCLVVADVDEAGKIQVVGTRNALNAAAVVFLAQLVISPGQMVVLHGPGKTPVIAPSPVSLMKVDLVIGTQRRRLGR